MSNKSTRTEEIAVEAIVVAIISERKNANWKKKPRPVWMKHRLSRRTNFWIYKTLLSELQLKDGNKFKNYV